MIKSPISKNGDIRYFELIKIIILISLLYGLLTKYSVKDFAPLSQATPLMTVIIIILLLIQFSLAGFRESQELMELVLSFRLKARTQLKIKFEDIQQIIVKLKNIFITYKNNTYLKINVIRC